MCTGLEVAALASAGAATVGAAQGYESSRRARRAASAAAEQSRQAESRATQDANARVAMRRRALAQNSLFTGGGDMASGMSAPGKATLGG